MQLRVSGGAIVTISAQEAYAKLIEANTDGLPMALPQTSQCYQQHSLGRNSAPISYDGPKTVRQAVQNAIRCIATTNVQIPMLPSIWLLTTNVQSHILPSICLLTNDAAKSSLQHMAPSICRSTTHTWFLSSNSTWSYSLSDTMKIMDVTLAKQWIHFRRSDRCPPTSTILHTADKVTVNNVVPQILYSYVFQTGLDKCN